MIRRQELSGGTYNLGFFFGPGLPRGLGRSAVSIICPRLLLDPAPGAFRFFEVSPFAESVAGAGVELDSEALSLFSEVFTMVASSTAGAGDEATEAADCSSDLGVGS